METGIRSAVRDGLEGQRRGRRAGRPATAREEGTGVDDSGAIAAGNPSGERPALVNVVLNRATPNGAAYAATLPT